MPGPVTLLCGYIGNHGLEVEGIFRKAGSSKRIQDLLDKICACFLTENGGGYEGAQAVLATCAESSKAAVCAFSVSRYCWLKDNSLRPFCVTPML